MEAIKEKMKESDRGSDDVFIERRLYGKTGIEIGGPSEAFKELLPIYRAAKKIDGVNFSEKTLWDSRKAGRDSFAYYEGKRGDQYILEATKLDGIADDSYDFLLASHSLEHIANPIKALKEWIRVVKPGGTIVVIVPNKEACFDHKRDYTSFEHILNDYERDIGEDDLTHLDEILEKHDLSMDTPAGTFKQFKERSLRNFSNRALHQHVFSPESLERVFDFLGISVEKSFVDGLNIVCIGRVPDKRS
jgi:ubiquinone/menaquinone biosynthesis C-methylase UbiE